MTEMFSSDELQSIRKDYTFIITGSSIVLAQRVEKVCKFMCALLKPNGINIELDDLLSGDSSRTRQTLGQVSKALQNTNLFSEDFVIQLNNFVQRRNRLIHSLFEDTFRNKEEIVTESPQSVAYFDFCEDFIRDGEKLVDMCFGVFHAIGSILVKKGMNDPTSLQILSEFKTYEDLGFFALKK